MYTSDFPLKNFFKLAKQAEIIIRIKKLSKTWFGYDYALSGKLANYLDTRIKTFLA